MSDPREPSLMPRVESIRWREGRLWLLDQRLLPGSETWLPIDDAALAAAAIRDLVVRGAPAIGITAAFASVLAARARGPDRAGWLGDLEGLQRSRPTAVNLRWALDRMRGVLGEQAPGEMADRLEHEALTILEQDRQANARMAALGAAAIAPGSGVLTHCNTGSLATGGTGTAIGVIVQAWREQRLREVFACETRPWLQGLRLTAWELGHEGVPVQMLVEGAAAGLLRSGRVDWVVTGADRITANGDVANKIGTLMLAVLARQFGARMMVVAPVSTLDPDTETGDSIEIEQRDPAEIWSSAGLVEAPSGATAFNPVFDITPAEYIDLIVTDRGVIEPPFHGRIQAIAAG